MGIKKWWRDHRPTNRRLAQLYCGLLYNAHLKGFVEGEIYTGSVKKVCVPGLNCYSCPGAVGACPLGALQNALATSETRSGTYIIGMLLLFGVALGRTICGWLCPVGLLQEILYKIPTFKIKKSGVTRILSGLKYVLLAVCVIGIPLWYGYVHDIAVPGFCKFICPAGTFEGAAALLVHPRNADLFEMLGFLFTNKFVIMFLIILASIFCFRTFCRFLCPLGAIYGLFNRITIIGVKVDPVKCTHCGKCVRNCLMDVNCVGDRECISCGECMSACNFGAISMKAGKVTLIAPNQFTEMNPSSDQILKKQRGKSGKILRGAALAVLLLALIFTNAFQPKKEAVIGCEVGDELGEFTAELYGGGQFDLSETRGQVTVINLWAVWCGPCVKELPYFSDFKNDNPNVEVLAVHSSVNWEDMDEFLSNKDFGIDFCADRDGTIFKLLGGSTMLPQTIIVNAEGIVTYNAEGSMSREKLNALVEEAGVSDLGGNRKE